MNDGKFMINLFIANITCVFICFAHVYPFSFYIKMENKSFDIKHQHK